jgi:hypothetical protein
VPVVQAMVPTQRCPATLRCGRQVRKHRRRGTRHSLDEERVHAPYPGAADTRSDATRDLVVRCVVQPVPTEYGVGGKDAARSLQGPSASQLTAEIRAAPQVATAEFLRLSTGSRQRKARHEAPSCCWLLGRQKASARRRVASRRLRGKQHVSPFALAVRCARLRQHQRLAHQTTAYQKPRLPCGSSCLSHAEYIYSGTDSRLIRIRGADVPFAAHLGRRPRPPEFSASPLPKLLTAPMLRYLLSRTVPKLDRHSHSLDSSAARAQWESVQWQSIARSVPKYDRRFSLSILSG